MRPTGLGAVQFCAQSYCSVLKKWRALPADAYLHAFDTLRTLPLVSTPEDNMRLTDILQRLVDEHGAYLSAHSSAEHQSTVRQVFYLTSQRSS